MTDYWFDNLTEKQSWTSLWNSYIICGNCRGIRRTEGLCPACSIKIPDPQPVRVTGQDGRQIEIPQNAFMGAEGRYEDYVYLNMLEQEWKRAPSEYDKFNFLTPDRRPAGKAMLVLVFWTYFETKIERLLASAMSEVPDSIQQNLLKRYPSISARTNELYKVLFGKKTSYYSDVKDLGFSNIAVLLPQVQERRNQFMHGSPEAIDEQLVDDLVKSLKDEHESWIGVFNLRATKNK